ncbi:MAG: class I SAM-dependent methyltransferase [Alphaproteobacteria bacterium]
MTRKQKILRGIDTRSAKGLEFGPLDRPIVTRADGDIAYVDLMDADALRARYARDLSIASENIVAIDFVQGDRSVVESVGAAAPFDYAVASHVFEHVPNPIEWLRDVGAVLRPGGKLALALPDKRFIFDRRRRTTTFDRMLDIYAFKLKRATPGVIYDAIANHAGFGKPAQVWAGDPTIDLAPLNGADSAFAIAMANLNSGQAVEVHCSVFTPYSFLENLTAMMRHGLIDLELDSFQTTAIADMEFFVTLRKLPPDLADRDRRSRMLASVSDNDVAARIMAAPEDNFIFSFSGLPLRYRVVDAIYNAAVWLPRRLRRAISKQSGKPPV